MEALRLEKTAGDDGIVHIEGLRPGENVEVIVLRISESASVPISRSRRLKGSLLKYDRPFEPVSMEDWDVLR